MKTEDFNAEAQRAAKTQVGERLSTRQLSGRERKRQARQAALELAERQVDKFLADVLAFVEEVGMTGSRPESWPLTDGERIAFLRRTVSEAKKLHSCEMFFVVDMRLKAKECA